MPTARTEALRRRAPSLALRITALVGLAVSVVLVLFALGIARSIERHFAEQDLGELQAVADSLTLALGDQASRADPRTLDQWLMRAVAGHHGVYFSVSDPRGEPLYSTAPGALSQAARATPASDWLDAAALQVWRADSHVYRGAVLRIGGDRVMVAVIMDFHLRYLSKLREALWLGTGAAAALALLATWLAVRWGHAPLRRLGATIRGISSEHLHVRLEGAQAPAELAPLVDAFNTMLDRLQDSFQRLSNFSADIAHELRTPITTLTTQTQVALSKPRSVEAYQEVLYASLEELERMGKMIADMLFLAQADHRLASPEFSAVSLEEEVRALFDYLEAWAEELGVALRLEGAAPAVAGDRLMLRRAISNLLSNALRYTPRGEAITVRLSTQGGMATIEVENPGAAIAPEHLPRLFDRFYRVDPARQHRSAADGTGLGLAIVRSIVEAHGGRVAANSGNGLTCFSFSVPLQAGGRVRSS